MALLAYSCWTSSKGNFRNSKTLPACKTKLLFYDQLDSEKIDSDCSLRQETPSLPAAATQQQETNIS
jgi:hypothetical protein